MIYLPEEILGAIVRPPLKKSLFLVQRVAKIVVSQAAVNFFFSRVFLFLGGGGVVIK